FDNDCPGAFKQTIGQRAFAADGDAAITEPVHWKTSCDNVTHQADWRAPANTSVDRATLKNFSAQCEARWETRQHQYPRRATGRLQAPLLEPLNE
ncbi:MAG: hypothetical protein WBN00_10390, partial [Sedimenticolaceae bacterium]